MAIETSHASSSRKRKLLIAWNAHVATDSRTTAASTMNVTRRALPGVIAIQRASSSKGTPGTAWLLCRWCGGELGCSGRWSALTRRAYGHAVSRAGDARSRRAASSGRMADTVSHVLETPFTTGEPGVP